MDIIDNIASPYSRKRKYSDKQILKMLVLLRIFNISYRSSEIFLENHGEYMELIGITEIPSFQTLSRRSRSLDLHTINMIIQSLYSINEIAAFDSFMIHASNQLQRGGSTSIIGIHYQDSQGQQTDGHMEGNATYIYFYRYYKSISRIFHTTSKIEKYPINLNYLL